jgi:hypothetical protein
VIKLQKRTKDHHKHLLLCLLSVVSCCFAVLPQSLAAWSLLSVVICHFVPCLCCSKRVAKESDRVAKAQKQSKTDFVSAELTSGPLVSPMCFASLGFCHLKGPIKSMCFTSQRLHMACFAWQPNNPLLVGSTQSQLLINLLYAPLQWQWCMFRYFCGSSANKRVPFSKLCPCAVSGY